MLHIKFDQDWPTGFRDIQDDGPLVYYKLHQATKPIGRGYSEIFKFESVDDRRRRTIGIL